MKKLFFLCLLFFFLLKVTPFAQNSGRGFSFQGIARDANGNIRKNETIKIKFEIKDNNNLIWSEESLISTDDFGTFNTIIGSETKSSTCQGCVNSFKDII
ncbi:MAG: hypothetical protein QXG00_08520 [Candidatus Woesearchaeota archaeon]